MIGRKAIVGLALLCSLAFCALAAQGAAAAGHGQTAFTCAEVQVNGEYSDAHCDNALVGGKYAHLGFTQTTNITLTNAATANETKSAQPAHLFVNELHGVKEVEVNCTTVTGTGEATNSETGGIMKASGSGTIEFTGCTANHSCTVTVAPTPVKAETVEGLASEGMGLKFEPKTGTVFTKLTFTGTSCPLKAFGAISVEGSTIGTAHNEPKGEGATVYFGSMNSLTIGGQTPVFEGIATLRGPNGNALVATTS
jgi:hypothetical protein